jgi:16S rRNA processing protein RimM
LGWISPSELILVGEVKSSHGLKGLLCIKSFARSETSFVEAGNVVLRTTAGEMKKFHVTYARNSRKGLILKLEGLETREIADRYQRAELFISKGDLRRDEDEYFWFELIGLSVFNESGNYLGSLCQVIPTGGTDIYLVRDGATEILIPATEEVVKEIDLAGKRMIVSPLDGLLDQDQDEV